MIAVHPVQQIGMKVFGSPQLRFDLIFLSHLQQLHAVLQKRSWSTFCVAQTSYWSYEMRYLQLIIIFKIAIVSNNCPGFTFIFSAGHTSCLSNSYSVQHLCKHDTLWWYEIAMPKSDARSNIYKFFAFRQPM